MDWLGFGVLIIGIAFAALVIILIKPLGKLTNALEGLEQTTKRLPIMLDDGANQANETFGKVNDTLANVNEQVKAINPVLHIVKDAGEASRQLTSVALEKTMAMKENTSEAKAFTDRKKYQGLYGILSFAFYISQQKKDLKNALDQANLK